jgi:hypothetical protein
MRRNNSTYRLQPSLRDIQVTAGREVKRREFDALQSEAIVLCRELAEPQSLLNLRLWPWGAHHPFWCWGRAV